MFFFVLIQTHILQQIFQQDVHNGSFICGIFAVFNRRDIKKKKTPTGSQITTITWEKTHRGVQASCDFHGLLPCELICDMLGAIINLHAPATIRSSSPRVSGSKFLIVEFCCAIDHTTLLILYLNIYSCHHLLSALSNSAQLEKQPHAGAFGISPRCLRRALPRAHSVTFCPADALTQRGAWKRKCGSPSPCTVVMRCPSRKRSTLERYEEGPLSTTTSFRTCGRTHKKQKHTLMITCKSLLAWLTTPCAWLGVGWAEVLNVR